MTAPTQPANRRRVVLWLAGGVVIAGVAVAATLAFLPQRSTAPAPVVPAPAVPADTFTMKGAFNLAVTPGTTTLKNGASCAGADTYADLRAGASVKVFDPQGKVLSSGNLSAGRFAVTSIGSACIFDLNITGVPDGLPTYGVEVGSHGVEQVDSSTAHSWVFLHVGP